MTDSKRRRRPGKVKGVVLVMVVTLLFVLVVMLMATLTVVGNANKRTVTKFEENQAYYTARSALDVYITGMLEMDETANLGSGGASRAAKALDKKFNDATAAIFETSPGSGVYKDFSKTNDIVEGFVYQQELFGYLTPKYQLSDVSQGQLLTDPKTDSHWKETKNWDNESEQSYRVTYKLALPDNMNSVTGLGAGQNVGVMASEKVDITVELLRMAYMKADGTVITDGTMTKSNANLAEVDWNKTYYRLKVTSTAKIKQGTGGVNEGTVSVLLEPGAVIAPSGFSSAMTSMDYTNPNNKMFTVGGGSASDPGHEMTINNNSAITGKYIYEVDYLKITTQPQPFRLPKNSYFIVDGGAIKFENAKADVGGYGTVDATGDDLNMRPYIYSAGITFEGQIGKNDAAVDVIVAADSGKFYDKIKNNVPNYFSTESEEGEKLALVTGQNGSEFYGDVYCQGNMYIGNQNPNQNKFHGNVYCSGNIYVQNENDLSVFGKNVVLSPDSKIMKIDWAGNVTDVTATAALGGTVSHDLVDMDLKGELSDDKTSSKINLPGSRSPLDVPNSSSAVVSYVYTEKDQANNAIPSGKTVGDVITAAEMFARNTSDPTAAKLSVKPSAKELLSNSGENKSVTYEYTSSGTKKTTTLTGRYLDPQDPAVATYNTDTDFYEMKMNVENFANNNETYIIDATSSNVQIQLTGKKDSANPKFVIMGDKAVVFTIEDGTNEVELRGFQALTWQMNDMLSDSASVLALGNDRTVNDSPKAPNIYMYIGNNTKLNLRNGNDFQFSGYMYGPEAEFYTNVGSNKTINYTMDDDSTVSSVSHVAVYGSIVFGTIEAQNELAAVHIPPDSNSNSPTASKVIWDRQRFLNR